MLFGNTPSFRDTQPFFQELFGVLWGFFGVWFHTRSASARVRDLRNCAGTGGWEVDGVHWVWRVLRCGRVRSGWVGRRALALPSLHERRAHFALALGFGRVRPSWIGGGASEAIGLSAFRDVDVEGWG